MVQGFSVGQCEGYVYRPDEMEKIIGYLTPQQLYAAYRVTPGPRVNPDAEYAAITSVDTDGSPVGWVVWIADARIIGTTASCGPVPPEQFAGELGLGQTVLPPQE